MQSLSASRAVSPAFGNRLWTVVGLSLGPAVANAFARFAYALLLPSMRNALDLTYAQAGALNTANAVGYLAGAVIAARYLVRFGNRRLFAAGMLVTVAALAGSGLADAFSVQLVLRALAGVGGALVFICGAVLASNIDPERPAFANHAIAIYFGGAGVGILLSGVGVPSLLAVAGDGAWREAWLAIAAISVAFGVIAVRASHRIDEPASPRRAPGWAPGELAAALGAYLLVGAGYIVYMTFVVAWMKSHGASASAVALTWGTLGATTLIAPLAWRGARARWYPARTLAATSAVLGLGAAIPLFSTSLLAMVLSAMVFGSAMFTAPAAVTDLVKSSLPKHAWGRAVATFTVVFAIGQAAGPMFTGWLADRTHSLHAVLEVSVAILLVAAGTAMAQREPGRAATHIGRALVSRS